MTTTELSAVDVANRVRPYVARTKVGGITLWMDEASIRLRNDYWNIHIRPSTEPEPLFPYYEALADLEEEVQESEGIKVSIAPGSPLIEQ